MRSRRLVRVNERRTAFTLLEMLLASAIGVLLMGALYVAVDVQLRHAQAGREVIAQSTLARALLNRIANDLMPSIAAPLPVGNTASSGGGGGAGGSGSGSGGSSASTAGGTSGTGSGGTTSGMGTMSATPSANSSTTTTATGMVVNIGVKGDNSQLTISVNRVLHPSDFGPEGAQIASDLCHIVYWLAGSSDTPLGLARLEIKLATSDDAANLVPPNIPDEQTHIIAEEVKSLVFSYFDGQSWQDSWDGTAVGADGVTPMGPPLAIAVVVGILPPHARPGADVPLKYYRHVIALPTANGSTMGTIANGGTGNTINTTTGQ
jgi:prepilin-type N-terminal cleavage/methylation domain-containing protein